MHVPESSIARVVAEASSQLSDPTYISTAVDDLAARQPAVMQYVVAHKGELAVDSIVQLLFQSALIERSVTDAIGKPAATVSYRRLDAAARDTRDLSALAKSEPDLAAFIHSNLDMMRTPAESELAARLLSQIARALVVATCIKGHPTQETKSADD